MGRARNIELSVLALCFHYTILIIATFIEYKALSLTLALAIALALALVLL